MTWRNKLNGDMVTTTTPEYALTIFRQTNHMTTLEDVVKVVYYKSKFKTNVRKRNY